MPPPLPRPLWYMGAPFDYESRGSSASKSIRPAHISICFKLSSSVLTFLSVRLSPSNLSRSFRNGERGVPLSSPSPNHFSFAFQDREKEEGFLLLPKFLYSLPRRKNSSVLPLFFLLLPLTSLSGSKIEEGTLFSFPSFFLLTSLSHFKIGRKGRAFSFFLESSTPSL